MNAKQQAYFKAYRAKNQVKLNAYRHEYHLKHKPINKRLGTALEQTRMWAMGQDIRFVDHRTFTEQAEGLKPEPRRGYWIDYWCDRFWKQRNLYINPLPLDK